MFQTLEDGLTFASPSNGYLIPFEKHRINIGFQYVKRNTYEIPIIVERIPKKAFGILLGFHSAGITEKRRGIPFGILPKKKSVEFQMGFRQPNGHIYVPD